MKASFGSRPGELATLSRIAEMSALGLTRRQITNALEAEGAVSREGTPYSLESVHGLMNAHLSEGKLVDRLVTTQSDYDERLALELACLKLAAQLNRRAQVCLAVFMDAREAGSPIAECAKLAREAAIKIPKGEAVTNG